MVVATYEAAIDLDASELFSESSEVVTTRVITTPRGTSGGLLFSSHRGLDSSRRLTPPRAGDADLILDNDDGTYGPASTLQAGRQMRVRATYSGTAYELIRGVIDSPVHVPGAGFEREAHVHGIGTLSRLANKPLSTAVYTNLTTDVALGYILDAVSWPKNLPAYVTASLTPAGQWGLGEASGTALDSSGNGNAGTVTIGVGSRDYAALDDAGDGAIDFDGADTKVSIADAAPLQNIFDGGGSVVALFTADTAGEGSLGRVVSKAGWELYVADLAAGLLKLRFELNTSGTQGQWATTSAVVTVGRKYLVAVSFNADSMANDPTLYLYDIVAQTYSVLTVGSGLTENTTPTGTRTTDVGSAFVIGNNAASSRTFDGRIDEVSLHTTTLTAAQIKVLCARSSNAPRHLDTGKTTLTYWWLDNEDAFSAAVQLVNTEGPGSVFYEDGAGGFVFKNRHARILDSRSATSQRTFRNTGAEPLLEGPWGYDPAIRDVVNTCSVEVKTRTVQAVQVVWTLGSTVTLGVGETRQYLVRGGNTQDATTGQYVGIFSGAITPSSGAGDYTVSSGSLTSIAIDRTSGAEVTITLVGGAAGATVTGLRLRAQPITVATTTHVASTIDTSTSQAQYGVRPYTLAVRPDIDVNTAQDFSNAIAGYYKNGRPTARFSVLGNASDERMTAVLATEVNDRVRVIEDNFSLDFYAFITGIAHELSAPATHRAYFEVEQASAASYFVLDTSVLDGADILAF